MTWDVRTVSDLPAVQVDNLDYWYQDGPPALQDVSLTIGRGEWVALIGENGSGKTTLVKHFNGLLRPRRGQVRVAGQDTAGQSIGELARQVGYVFQSPDHQIFSSTVVEELAFGLRNLGLSSPEIEARTAEALALFELGPYAAAPPAILGYGLRRRITVAAVWAMRPEVVVLDEPTTGLDRRHTLGLMGHMLELHRRGHTLILITHDMKLVARYAQRVVVMHQGRIIGDGLVRPVLRDEELLGRSSLAPPPITALARRLAPCGLAGDSLTVEEFEADYRRLRTGRRQAVNPVG
ncbi:MAG: energy-coupling factor ABC transporter ATP-binding protein [Anaerolineae bacterium]